jgi:trehalose 6-phosphate synthase
MPFRAEILRGLLGADLVGFKQRLAAQNFVRLARHLLGLRYEGQTIDVDGRPVKAGAYPISIDVAEMEKMAADPSVQARAKQIRAELGDPKTIILGVDRLDYTKGIELRLKAFRELLSDGKLTVPEAVMVQVATPSRERVEHYQTLRVKVEREVGRINGEFGRVGVPAVHYLHQSYSRNELAALYCAADVMMVTPLRDGMNLVAKEYVASRADTGGSLVLSEFAGAATELRQAFLCNPHDPDGVKDALLRAVHVDDTEAKRRMRLMQRHLRTHDVGHWARSFLRDLGVPEADTE